MNDKIFPDGFRRTVRDGMMNQHLADVMGSIAASSKSAMAVEKGAGFWVVTILLAVISFVISLFAGEAQANPRESDASGSH